MREWYIIISREIFNPNYALFKSSPGDRVTYTINDFSHINSNHLCYFKFVGRVIAKAIYDNKLLECYFTRSFYKHILAKLVKHQVSSSLQAQKPLFTPKFSGHGERGLRVLQGIGFLTGEQGHNLYSMDFEFVDTFYIRLLTLDMIKHFPPRSRSLE